MRDEPKAVVLLSGGLDSTTCLAIAKARGFQPLALTFRYGQRHEVEIEASRRVARAFGVRRHVVAALDGALFGGSALTDPGIDVPKGRSAEQMGADIPVTYVPARNTVFLAMALAMAEANDARDIFIGVNALDYSGYPDCRPEYIEAFQRMADLATAGAVRDGRAVTIHAPLIAMSKAEIVAEGNRLGVDWSLTSTCYDPDRDGAACGRCDACRLRLDGFAAAGAVDPIAYAQG